MPHSETRSPRTLDCRYPGWGHAGSRRTDWGHAATVATILSIIVLAILPVAALEAQTPECPGYDDDLGIVWGYVRAIEGGVPVPGASIVVRWAGGDAEAQSIRTGVYIVCGVRTGVPVVAQATLEPFGGAGVAVELERGGIAEVPLNVAFGDASAVATTGRIVGTVVDSESLKPITNALIGAGVRGYTGVTDGAGRFRLDGVVPGQQTIQVRHIAYGETESTFLMPSDGTLEIQVRLDPAVVPVDPLVVRIVGMRSHRLEMSGFYERRDWNERLGLGHYITRLDIEARSAGRVSHILTEVPRVDLLRGDCLSGRCDFPIITASSPNCRRAKQEGVELIIGASLYLDGRRVRHVGVGNGVDDFVMPADVAGIEVYTGSGDLPAEFADFNAQRCGAIVIWTGR